MVDSGGTRPAVCVDDGSLVETVVVVLVVPTTSTCHHRHCYAMSYHAVVGISWSSGLG